MHYEVRSIGYYILEQQLVKHLLKGRNLISKHFCKKSVCWNSLIRVHRRRGDLIYLYQILKGSYDIENHLFTPSTSTVTRGRTRKLFKHHTNSYTRSNFYNNRVINNWNSLPQSIVDSPSVNDFKTLLDRHYSNCLFDFV